ncbi:hypothetical protein [Candidatus Burkholderia verschuerenii]|uniref:hypothetical protein n=1 Tax=Candidatus Burkholderia verschuerenii TaxID=242163 RepID=UPI00067A7FC6|nr:hypothetical protein [Candidatus Burkholderia verschuerenii]
MRLRRPPCRPRRRRAPQYIGDTQGQPASPHGPQYLGQTPAQQPAAPAAPAAQSSTPHAPRYLEQSPIQPSSSGTPQLLGNATAPVTAPHATAAAARPIAQRVPVVAAQGTAAATTTQAAPRTAVTSVNTVATTATLATTPTSAQAHIDGDKTEALERAIKQYGWSGSDTMPKPAE